jgi:TorA maturation chaperone TorD
MSQAKSIDLQVLENFRHVVADDLDLLAVLHSHELEIAQLTMLKKINFPQRMGYSLSAQKAYPVQKQLAEHIASWPDEIDDAMMDELAADFAAIYLNHTYNSSPMESVWIDEENLAYQQPMFDIRDIYREHQLEVANWRMRPDDHLVIQIQFIAYLLRSKPREVNTLHKITRFMDEHLLRWIDDFSQRVANRCETEFYGLLGLLTACYLNEIRDMLAEIIGEPRPTAEEIEERMKKKHAQPEAVPMQYVPGVAESW